MSNVGEISDLGELGYAYATPYEVQPEIVAAYLQDAQNEPDPSEQLRMLAGYNFNYRFNPYKREAGSMTDEASLLVDIATTETESVSMSARLMALERALERGYAGNDNFYTPPQNAHLIEYDTISINYVPERRFSAGKSYRHISSKLLVGEGIEHGVLFPEWTDYEIDRWVKLDDFNAFKAFMFLSQVEADLKTDEPGQTALQFEPMLKALHQKMADINGLPEAPDIDLESWEIVSRCTSLLESGDHYRQALVDVLNSHNKDAMANLETLASIDERTLSGAAKAFPKRYVEGVTKGLKLALSDALYAILHHAVNNNTTDTVLPLRSGNEGLPLKLTDNEPGELISALKQTLETMKLEYGKYPDVKQTVRVAKTSSFNAYRFAHYNPYKLHDPFAVKQTSTYIRARGGEVFDGQLEYGKLGVGVEASIGYITDLSPADGRLPLIGKRRGRRSEDSRISIRLDREGVDPEQRESDVKHDPTQQAGTLSLDIGSVLGNDNWLSTKLGRFLAHGNMLRAQSRGEAVHLNHVTEYFSAEDGDADVFAASAEELVEIFEQQRFSLKEIAQYCGTKVKVVGRLLKA